MAKVTGLTSNQLGRLKETLEANVRKTKGKSCSKGKPCGGSCISKAKACHAKPGSLNRPKSFNNKGDAYQKMGSKWITLNKDLFNFPPSKTEQRLKVKFDLATRNFNHHRDNRQPGQKWEDGYARYTHGGS